MFKCVDCLFDDITNNIWKIALSICDQKIVHEKVDTSAELTCCISSFPLSTQLLVAGIQLQAMCSQVNGDTLSLMYVLLFFAESQIIGRVCNKSVFF